MLEAQALSIHVASSSSLQVRPDFLASLEAQTDPSCQVIFVDLGTGKVSPALEREVVCPAVIRLRTFRNMGIVRGQNQAIALALSRWPRETWSERFVVLSRPEVAFDRRFCQMICQAFAADHALMVAGPKVFWADAVPQREDDWIELQCSDQLYAAGIGLTRGRALRFIGQGSQDTGQFDGGEGVFLLSDACVVIRASALEALALAEGTWLDPRLPAFFSVLDLCWRGARRGFRPQLVPEARIWFAPQDEARAKRKGWRESYFPRNMRKETDDLLLRVLHTPWLFVGYLRYLVSQVFFSRFWTERLKLEQGAVEHLKDLKFRRRAVTAVPLAERRRWFLP
jgi:GT2 family glycosyltransferase